ncbi:FecR family protein [Neorhodopirellula lusitana]|uniref:FecR family protein n=1 Tax=Neorhodopirellula lusitana TaxID=445327 RepID=A0ABY1PSQ2_9BACT|nr:FecR domain-containing protein [Neorhodopirellula lusitana]SMP42237.1 FecR family protein [Neorhodopirellula lusitana]
MTKQTERRIDELLLQVTGGDCTSEERDELNELLRAHPELHTAVVESLVMDALIMEHLQVQELPTLVNALLVDDFESTKLAGSRPEQGLLNPWPKSSSMPSLSAMSWTGILGAAAAILVGASLFVTGLLRPDVDVATLPSSPVTQPSAAKTFKSKSVSKTVHQTEPNVVVGAITLSGDARWSPEKKVGDPVVLGDLNLFAGRGRIHLTNGVIIWADATKQPVEMCFNGDGSLDVLRGKVSADVSEEALGFSMQTPSTRVVDAGTRFSVDVDPSVNPSDVVSRVTVLSGAVSCLPAKGQVKKNLAMLVPGKTMQFQGPRDYAGTQLDAPLVEAGELDWMKSSGDLHDRNLIAYENFRYPVGVFGKNLNGEGWSNFWHRSSYVNGVAVAVIRDGSYIASPAWMGSRDSRYFVVPAATGCGRELANPISLDQDRDIYVSFGVRKKRLAENDLKRSASGITFRASPEKDSPLVKGERREIVALASIGHGDRLLCSTGVGRYRTGRALESDRSYLMVMKLAIRKDEPDQVMARAYEADSMPPMVPPTKWDCQAKPSRHSGWLQTVNLWSDPHAIVAFDELRIGDTWESVVPLRN